VAIGADVTPETAVALMTGALAVATFWLAGGPA